MTRPQPAQPAGVRIAGTGMAVPPNRVTNDDLAQRVDTSDEWIRPRTGIAARHIAEDDQKTSDLAAEALGQAVSNTGIAPGDLDMVIVATMTPDMICPATASLVAAKIGASPCGAMDINIACTGLVAALNTAANYVMSGFYKHVGVVGADCLSRIVNWEDRRTCVLFGDAAGAAVISASDDPEQRCLYQTLHSDGNQWESLYVPRDRSDLPASVDPAVTDEAGFNGMYDTLQMKGRDVYKFAVHALQDCVRATLDATGLTPDDVKMVIPHQSNIRMLQTAWKKLGFPDEKIYINIDRFGNTSAASIGLCLHELMNQEKLHRGDHIIFVAQGGGLSWGASAWRL